MPPRSLDEIEQRLEEYQWYRFVYQRFASRVWDECVAQYLGVNRSNDEVILNLRPLAGTSSLKPRQIQAVYRARKPEPMLPRRCAQQPTLAR